MTQDNLIKRQLGILAVLAAFLLVFSSGNVFAQSMTEMMWGVDRQGNDYHNFKTQRWDPNLCLNECAVQSNCKAWAYVVSTNTCFLKDQNGGSLEVQDDVVSGAKVQ